PMAAAPAPGRARRGLAALVAAALLVPAAIFGAGAWVAWRATWSEVDRELGAAAEAAAEFSQRVIESHALLAARIADSLDGIDDAAIPAVESLLQERLARVVEDVPLVLDVLVVGAAGDVLLRTATAPTAIPVAYGQGFLDAVNAPGAGEIVVGAAHRDPANPLHAFSLARRRDGTPGAIVILLHAGRMGERLGRLLEGHGASVALLRSDGRIVARHPAMREAPPQLAPDRPLMLALAAGREAGLLDGETPRDGQPVRVAFRRVEGRTGVVVAVAQQRAGIVARWQASLMPLLLVALPATLALWAFAWMVHRRQQALEATLEGLEQRVAERTASLREGEERLRLAIDAGRIGTWEADIATGITTRSGRSLEILGLPADAEPTLVTEWDARIHPADRHGVRTAREQVSSGAQPGYRVEYRYQRPDGSWRWVESTAAVVRTDPVTGKPLRLAGTNRDITERREAEERRDLLTKEVNHRARNTLAIVQAILRLTRAEDAAGYARLIEGRIAALARAQSLLAAERWTGAPLGTLLAEELVPFGGAAEARTAAGARFALD
ncbi:HWE histidine kinase domain-containing protein, partial [Roseomonas rosulenta]|uniref:HWE histidine kinase domain-containing protein n=1 Tax=Roseomonas rosulenta TaxID=2748667 RepID=UPI0018DF6D56